MSVSSTIAIIGMSGRFPAATTLAEFWRNIASGRQCISHFDQKTLDDRKATCDGAHYVLARGVLDGVEQFDAPFFGFSPYEASIIDPQQRLFIQASHEALELAGYPSEEYAGKTGVFVSMADSTYLHNNVLKKYPEPNARYQLKHTAPVLR